MRLLSNTYQQEGKSTIKLTLAMSLKHPKQLMEYCLRIKGANDSCQGKHIKWAETNV